MDQCSTTSPFIVCGDVQSQYEGGLRVLVLVVNFSPLMPGETDIGTRVSPLIIIVSSN